VVAEGKVTEVNVDFDPGNAGIEGSITLEGGGIRRGHLQLQQVDANDSSTGEHAGIQIDASGGYRMEGYPAGHYRVQLWLETTDGDNRTWQGEVDLIANRIVRLDINLTRGVKVSGMVTPWQNGLRGMVFAVPGNRQIEQFTEGYWEEFSRNIVGYGEVQGNGSYEITGIAVGEYTIFALTYGTEPTSFADILNKGKLGRTLVNAAAGQTEIVANLAVQAIPQ